MNHIKTKSRPATLLVGMLGAMALTQAARASLVLTLEDVSGGVKMTVSGSMVLNVTQMYPSTWSQGFASLGGDGVIDAGPQGTVARYIEGTGAVVEDWVLSAYTLPLTNIQGAITMDGPFASYWLASTVSGSSGNFTIDYGSGAFSALVPNMTISQLTSTASGTTIWQGAGGSMVLQYTPQAVPEPSMLALGGLGVMGLALRRRRDGAC